MNTARTEKRHGQVVVLAPAMIVVVGAMLALTVDVGQMFYTEACLQNACDAGSLAAAHVLFSARKAGQTEQEARATALAEASAIALDNCADAGLSVEFGYRDENGEFVLLEDCGTEATAARVTASRDGEAPGGPLALSFSSLLGLDACDVLANGTAEAAADVRGILSGLRPFAIHEDDVVAPGQYMTFYDDGLLAPGLFGLLNLDGGSCGTPELRVWILNGYDGEIIIGEDGYVWIDGTPGFRSALKSQLGQIIGDPVTMVIYDQITGQGSNGDFRCVGFLMAHITDFKLTGNNKYIECQVEGTTGVHDVVMGGSYQSPNMRKVQLVD
ncbi:MAG: pilus assembly protein TadG-related protein [Planctomycetota bacterium]|jgi:hypothetical protein